MTAPSYKSVIPPLVSRESYVSLPIYQPVPVPNPRPESPKKNVLMVNKDNVEASIGDFWALGWELVRKEDSIVIMKKDVNGALAKLNANQLYLLNEVQYKEYMYCTERVNRNRKGANDRAAKQRAKVEEARALLESRGNYSMGPKKNYTRTKEYICTIPLPNTAPKLDLQIPLRPPVSMIPVPIK
jgi:hypothetical protein